MIDEEKDEALRLAFREHCQAFGVTYQEAHGAVPEGSAILRAMIDVMADVVVQAPPPLRAKLWSRLMMALALTIDLTPEEMTAEIENMENDCKGNRLDS